MNFVRTIVLMILVALLVCGCASSRVATNPTTLPDPTQTIGVYSNVLTDELKKENEAFRKSQLETQNKFISDTKKINESIINLIEGGKK